MILHFIKMTIVMSTVVALAACGGGGENDNAVENLSSPISGIAPAQNVDDSSSQISLENTNKSKDSDTDALVNTSLKSQFQATSALPGEGRGFALTSVIWPISNIPTCWYVDATTFAKYQAAMLAVQDAVRNTWEKYSDVRFVGWGRCITAENGGISIAIADVNPGTAGLGTRIKNQPGGMVLNFEYNTWSPACKISTDMCNRYVAVHEFGHALGFAHEQNRQDTPFETCTEPNSGTIGNYPVGGWDLESVMNYCNPRWNNDGKLSPADIQMVQLFYGNTSILDLIAGVF